MTVQAVREEGVEGSRGEQMRAIWRCPGREADWDLRKPTKERREGEFASEGQV